MSQLFKKLQLKEQDPILIMDAPEEFGAHLEAAARLTTVNQKAIARQTSYAFVLFFVKSCQEIENGAGTTAAKIAPDGVLWFAYPK